MAQRTDRLDDFPQSKTDEISEEFPRVTRGYFNKNKYSAPVKTDLITLKELNYNWRLKQHAVNLGSYDNNCCLDFHMID